MRSMDERVLRQLRREGYFPPGVVSLTARERALTLRWPAATSVRIRLAWADFVNAVAVKLGGGYGKGAA